MAVKILSATHSGLEGILIKVEVDITKGIPAFNIVGLPDTSVREARERVRTAILNSGFEFPLGRITVNLAPADVRKIGTLLDLPIAIGILMESGQIIKKDLEKYIIFGELSLFGELKPVKGTLPIIIEGVEENTDNFIFPFDNFNEAKYFDEGKYYPFKNLKEVISYIIYEDVLPQENYEKGIDDNYDEKYDFGKIIGQNSSKRALEVAVAGRHNIIMYGQPGCGKTMLANAIRSILPPLTKEELLEIAKIYSICGLSNNKNQITRPFRSPHHTTTNVALVGGGKDIKPGEITLAHKGVLFLDEILEFKKEALEALREPIEQKHMDISRINGTYRMPSDFLLVGAFNPAEVEGEDMSWERKYNRTREMKKYYNKFSSALIDRIDIMNYVPRLSYSEIKNKTDSYNSKVMRERIMKARYVQEKRLKDTSYSYNSEITGRDVFELCKVTTKCRKIMEDYYNKFDISLRGYTKIIKLARTISDLDLKEDITEGSILEAFTYRRDVSGEII